jgi:hypothetical protein
MKNQLISAMICCGLLCSFFLMDMFRKFLDYLCRLIESITSVKCVTVTNRIRNAEYSSSAFIHSQFGGAPIAPLRVRKPRALRPTLGVDTNGFTWCGEKSWELIDGWKKYAHVVKS